LNRGAPTGPSGDCLTKDDRDTLTRVLGLVATLSPEALTVLCDALAVGVTEAGQ